MALGNRSGKDRRRKNVRREKERNKNKKSKKKQKGDDGRDDEPKSSYKPYEPTKIWQQRDGDEIHNTDAHNTPWFLDDLVEGFVKKDIGRLLPKRISGENWIEQLHHRTLYTIFKYLAVVAGLTKLVGRRMTCHGFKLFDKDFVKAYCWTQGLFVNKYAYDLPVDSLPAPGITPCVRTEDAIKCNLDWDSEGIVYHKWYQFIAIYFGLSALYFLLPHWVARLPFLPALTELSRAIKEAEYKCGEKAIKLIGKTFGRIFRVILSPGFSSIWRRVMFPVQLLVYKASFIGITVLHFWVTGQMFPLGNYYKLGLEWHIPETDNHTHIGDVLFPKMAGCRIVKWEASGLASESGMCNLAPNVVNQYLFLVAWGCLVVAIGLNVLNVLSFIYEIALRYVNPNVYEMFVAQSPDSPGVGEGDLEGCSAWENAGVETDTSNYASEADIRLLLTYYNTVASRIILSRIAALVHPAVLAGAVRHVADEIREVQTASSEMRRYVQEQEVMLQSKWNNPVFDFAFVKHGLFYNLKKFQNGPRGK